MGGTDQDGHRALRLNGTLTQTDTQVVPPFSFLVTRIRNKMPFCCALLFPFCSDLNFQHPMTRIWQRTSFSVGQLIIEFSQRQTASFAI